MACWLCFCLRSPRRNARGCWKCAKGLKMIIKEKKLSLKPCKKSLPAINPIWKL
ncbi:hypothetical protein Hanom_Chr11g00971061 [Helianthus anomalus]